MKKEINTPFLSSTIQQAVNTLQQRTDSSTKPQFHVIAAYPGQTKSLKSIGQPVFNVRTSSDTDHLQTVPLLHTQQSPELMSPIFPKEPCQNNSTDPDPRGAPPNKGRASHLCFPFKPLLVLHVSCQNMFTFTSAEDSVQEFTFLYFGRN